MTLQRLREYDGLADEKEQKDPNYLDELMLPMIYQRESRAKCYIDDDSTERFDNYLKVIQN